MQTKQDYSGGQLCEEYGFCPCGYGYEFSMGNVRQSFGPMVVIYCYNFTNFQSKKSEWLEWLYCKLWRFLTMDGCILMKAK
jgi:hypothetical protein